MALTHVIAYDISEDARRARVAAVLQAHGDRVQRSVFVCTLESDDLRELCDRLSQIINPPPTPCTSSASAPPAGTLSASTDRPPSPANPSTGPCCEGGLRSC
jgi:hypothetical protein